jgi:hypothetical protein
LLLFPTPLFLFAAPCPPSSWQSFPWKLVVLLLFSFPFFIVAPSPPFLLLLPAGFFYSLSGEHSNFAFLLLLGQRATQFR